MVNELLHLETRQKAIKGTMEVERYLRCHETTTVMSGDRSMTLGPIVPANLGLVIDTIINGRSETARLFQKLATNAIEQDNANHNPNPKE